MPRYEWWRYQPMPFKGQRDLRREMAKAEALSRVGPGGTGPQAVTPQQQAQAIQTVREQPLFRPEPFRGTLAEARERARADLPEAEARATRQRPATRGLGSVAALARPALEVAKAPVAAFKGFQKAEQTVGEIGKAIAYELAIRPIIESDPALFVREKLGEDVEMRRRERDAAEAERMAGALYGPTWHKMLDAAIAIPVIAAPAGAAGVSGRLLAIEGLARQMLPDAGTALKAAGPRIQRATAETLLKVPSRPVKEAGLKVAGIKPVMGAGPPDTFSLKGIEAEIKRLDQAIATGRRTKADVRGLQDARDGLVSYRQNTLELQLTETELADYMGARRALEEAREELTILREPGGARPAPKFGTHERSEWEAERRLRSEAGRRTLNKKQQTDRVRARVAPLQQEVKRFEDLAESRLAGTAPEVPAPPLAQRGQIQAGMGIGERPPQGQLLGEFRGEAVEGPPLVDTEAILAREARQAEIAAGQRELPEAAAAAKEPWQGTVYRGVSDLTPVDKGHFGRGLTFSTKREVARNYGAEPVVEGVVRLERPYILDATTPKGIAAAEAFVRRSSAATTPELKAAGYDGVVVRGWHGTGGDEVVAFYPEQSFTQTAAAPPTPPLRPTEAAPVAPAVPPRVAQVPPQAALGPGQPPRAPGGPTVPPSGVPIALGPGGRGLPSGRVAGGLRAPERAAPSPAPAMGKLPPVPPGTKLPSRREPGGLGRAKPPPPRNPYQMLIDSLQPEREPLLSKLRRGIPEQMYDRNYPLKELERATGVPARQTAQVVPGAVTAGEDIVRRFYAPIVKPVEKDLKFLERYMVLMRDSDILARNPHARLPGGLANERERLIALESLAQDVGAERFAKIQQAAADLWRANDEQVLRPWLDEGIITSDMYRAMKSDHPHYIPFQRADFTEVIHNSISARPEANLSTTGIKKMGLEGSERTLAEPLMKLLQEPIKAKTIIFRNRAAKSIVRALEQLQRQTGEELVRYIDPKREMGVVQRVTGQKIARLKKGEISQEWETISFFENGVKNRVEVPAVYGRVAKGLEAEPDNIALKLARAANAPLRYGATTYNPFFLPVNVVRDATAAMFREKVFPFGPDYWAGLWAAIRKNATFSEASQSGALLSGVVENMNPARALKTPLGGITVRNPWEAVTLPFRLVEEANIIAERGVRLATFRKLKAEGVERLELAVRTRDATVDFAKSGHAMRVINQVIPFTNATVQGQANIIRTIRDHPIRSAAFATMFATGAVMERVNNMRFDTSQLIPDYEYTRNWVLQFGEGERSDGTKFPIYLKIPKGEIAAMFTFPVEALFNLARPSEDRSAVELLLSSGFEISRALSPIEIGGVTGLLPPSLETGVGLQTGIDPFTGFPIVPQREEGLPPEQQFGRETSQTAVQLGQLFNVSPRLIDFALTDVAAGAGQATNWLISMGLEALGIEPEIFGEDDPDRDPLPTGLERMTKERVPGVSRFLGTRDTQLKRRGYDNLADAVVDTNRAFSNLPDVSRLGIRFGKVGNSIEGIELTLQQQAQYQEIAGREALRLLPPLFLSARYRRLSDDDKEALIRKTTNSARAKAREEMLRLIQQPRSPMPTPTREEERRPAGVR